MADSLITLDDDWTIDWNSAIWKIAKQLKRKKGFQILNEDEAVTIGPMRNQKNIFLPDAIVYICR